MKQWKLISLLNLNLWVHVFLIFCVTKWSYSQRLLLQMEVHVRARVCVCVCVCVSVCENLIFLPVTYAVVWVASWINCFIHGTSFYLKEQLWNEPWLLRLGFWQIIARRWIKWTYYFQKNNWQYLLLMIKFEYSSKNFIFGKLVSVTVSLTVSPYLKAFYEMGGDINKCYFLILNNDMC